MRKKLVSDVKRIVALVSLIAIFFWASKIAPIYFGVPILAPLLSSSAVIMSVCLNSHIVRRVLFPNVDLGTFIEKSFESSLSSSIATLAICIVLAAVIVASAVLCA